MSLTDLLADMRQRRHPPEFRIAQPTWPDSLGNALEEIARLLEAPPAPAPTATPVRAAPVEDKERDALIAQVATGLWRLSKRLLPLLSQTDLPKETRSLALTFQTTWNLLKQANVEIREHTGEKVLGGESYDIIAFQPTPGLSFEQVLETETPSIYYCDRLLRPGKVIVGTPETRQAGGPAQPG